MTSQDDLIRASVAADVIRMGEATYWRRRARQFEDAKPRVDDFHGVRSRVELSGAWQRCDRIARACRHRAELAEADLGAAVGQDLFEVEHLREVA